MITKPHQDIVIVTIITCFKIYLHYNALIPFYFFCEEFEGSFSRSDTFFITHRHAAHTFHHGAGGSSFLVVRARVGVFIAVHSGVFRFDFKTQRYDYYLELLINRMLRFKSSAPLRRFSFCTINMMYWIKKVHILFSTLV